MFPLCCAGLLQVVKTPHTTRGPVACLLKPLRGLLGAGSMLRRSRGGVKWRHSALLTLNLMWRQSRPLWFPDKSSADTRVLSGNFRWKFNLDQSEPCVSGFCRMSMGLHGRELDRCRRSVMEQESFSITNNESTILSSSSLDRAASVLV